MRLSALLRKAPLLGKDIDRYIILNSGLFNSGYYFERYPDVTSDPILHYLRRGASELRDPSPHFRTHYYLEQNPDVSAAGINPLIHFIMWGAREGRDPNPYFDSSFYLESYADVRESEANPLAHFLAHGRKEGRDPSPRCSPRIHLYATCWNEVRLLGFFFKHYDSVVQRYMIYDEGSNDGSLDLLIGHPKVEVRRFVRRYPDSFVLSELDLFNNCWKESRGFRGSPSADWVIVCNIDEHLMHPDLGGYLSKCLEAGITAIPALGYQMLSDEFPRPSEHLCKTRTSALPDPTDCKLILFSPSEIKEINYKPGGHVAQPEGRVIAPARDELLLLNYQILGIDYTLKRFAELRSGLGPLDHARGWGFHYGWTREDLNKFFAALPQQGVNTAVVKAKPWKNYPRPKWWRSISRKHVYSSSPLLSIVTTVYDRSDCLEACIKSVRNLNFQDYEHVIVADHPPEHDFSRIKVIIDAACDQRILLYNLSERTNNFGISPAEFGLKKATGKYIAFLDDDNGYLPNHFDALIDCLESDPSIGFVYSSCLWDDTQLLNYPTPALGKIDLGQILFHRNTFRDCINDELHYSDYAWDWHLISNFISKGVTYKHIDQETFIFRLKKYPQFAPQ
ncbi:MAG: glycosyltransferase [Proteobacteria bacterium]|nr:glycosyltransferase [Pseudomonadota bacterium]